MSNGIKSICIVGGGTAGWMAASLFSAVLRGQNIKMTVVESPDIATIGVGESTVPSIMDFITACQIDLKEFIQATSASFKLGIRFDDWSALGDKFFHPFGHVGKEINGFEFYQAWLKSLADGHQSNWLDYSPSAVMAQHQHFMLRPQQPQNWVLASYAHALHLDATQVTSFLRQHCLKHGVQRIEATITQVMLDQQQHIDRLVTENGVEIDGDFFVDCTGFNGLLIEKTLNTGYENWSHYLPCDRAVTLQTRQHQSIAPYTIACAKEAGWTWQIPLQHRTGNGYVFASQFCSDKQAIDTLMRSVQGEPIHEPRVIPFTTGKRDKIWHKNCLALGLAAGFLEPLESTAIHLVYKTLVHFIKHFPDGEYDAFNQQLFNQKIDNDYHEIRDFIILHYCISARTDTEFWRWCQKMPVPDSLKEKLCIFRQRGYLDYAPGQFFTNDSWYSILEGMKVRPTGYHPLLDGFDQQSLANTLVSNKHSIEATVMNMPNHGEYLKTHCPAKS